MLCSSVWKGNAETGSEIDDILRHVQQLHVEDEGGATGDLSRNSLDNDGERDDVEDESGC